MSGYILDEGAQPLIHIVVLRGRNPQLQLLAIARFVENPANQLFHHRALLQPTQHLLQAAHHGVDDSQLQPIERSFHFSDGAHHAYREVGTSLLNPAS